METRPRPQRRQTTSWLKLRNPTYSQMQGRPELFRRATSGREVEERKANAVLRGSGTPDPDSTPLPHQMTPLMPSLD